VVKRRKRRKKVEELKNLVICKMILKFNIFLESIKYDTYNGPSITTFSGDNRGIAPNNYVSGGNGGVTAGAEFDNQNDTTTLGEKPILAKRVGIKELKHENKKKRRLRELLLLYKYQVNR
jgi:hypothetical protein